MKLKIILAWLLGGVMTVLSFYPSWSQTAGTKEDPLFYATILTIIICFFQASKEHGKKYTIIGFGKNLGWFLGLSSFLFSGVLVFSVNNELWWVETLHLVFTGLAIAVPYYAMIKFYPNGIMFHGALLSLVVGVLGFLGAFIGGWYNIGIGEFMAATPLVVWLYFSSKWL